MKGKLLFSLLGLITVLGLASCKDEITPTTTVTPTVTPTVLPTVAPTVTPTVQPTVVPTVVPVQTYTVTFAGEGVNLEPQTVKHGEYVTKPADPTLAGHSFIGWYNQTVEFNFSTPVTSNLTLTAKFVSTSTDSIYAQLATHPGNLIAEDFNSYSSTDKLSDFTAWGTKGIYSFLNEKTAGTANPTENYVQLGDGIAQMVDTGGNGTQIVVDYGQNIESGILYGYFEATISNVGNSWTFLQLQGLATGGTGIAEVFGIRTDSGTFKYRLGSSGAVTAPETSIATANAKFDFYFEFDMDSKTLTMTINGQPFVTNLAMNVDYISGFKLVSSDNGSKLMSVDNLAIALEDYSLAEYKEIWAAELTKYYNSLNVTQNYPTVASEITSLYENGITNINGASSKALVKTMYNGTVSAIETKLLGLQKQQYINNLNAYADKSLYTINLSQLNSAISAGTNAINASTDLNGILAAAKAEKVTFLETYAQNAISSLNASTNATEIALINTELTNGKTNNRLGESICKRHI